MVNYDHRFIPHAARVLAPLHRATNAASNSVKTHINLTSELSDAFENVKKALADATMLYHRESFAFTAVTIDNSNTAVVGVLQQWISVEWHLLQFGFLKLSKAEQKLLCICRRNACDVHTNSLTISKVGPSSYSLTASHRRSP